MEFGGCLKNIYAIAAGCCDGLHLGDNTNCLLYTSDAADDLPCVDLGGRRIIKKKIDIYTVTRREKLATNNIRKHTTS